MIRAILFDLGSTLWDDYPAELHQWQVVARLLARRGIEVSLEELISLSEHVVTTFCPSLTRSMVFQLVDRSLDAYYSVIDELQHELLQRFESADEFMRLNPLFPGVHGMLDSLARHYKLGIVSQNFAEAQRWMGYHGLNEYFGHTSLSNREGLFKPDPRLFLHACNGLGVTPAEAIMVGDRLDNDIWPANRLQMVSVRVLADPYRLQIPRYHCDVPMYTLKQVAELEAVVPQLAR